MNPFLCAAGYQACMVAPTELLAEQHYGALLEIAEQLPLPLRPRVALLTGDLRTGSKVSGIRRSRDLGAPHRQQRWWW